MARPLPWEWWSQSSKAAGKRAIACGNVGTPVIEVLTSSDFYEYLIVELSSFQLHWTSTLQLDAAALLNIDDDHLDWHGNFDNYLKAKLKIFNGVQYVIINSDDPEASWFYRRFTQRARNHYLHAASTAVWRGRYC